MIRLILRCFISLHFRIGDYAKLQQYHCLLNIQYYIDSIKHIINKTNKDDWVILYCCEKNDLKLIQQKIKGMKNHFPNIVFERVSDNYQDWEQMLIMSLCRHNIIANSTFSWWSAYFNDNEDKIVCYPSAWFGPMFANKNTNDLFMEDWIKIICKQ